MVKVCIAKYVLYTRGANETEMLIYRNLSRIPHPASRPADPHPLRRIPAEMLNAYGVWIKETSDVALLFVRSRFDVKRRSTDTIVIDKRKWNAAYAVHGSRAVEKRWAYICLERFSNITIFIAKFTTRRIRIYLLVGLELQGTGYGIAAMALISYPSYPLTESMRIARARYLHPLGLPAESVYIRIRERKSQVTKTVAR